MRIISASLVVVILLASFVGVVSAQEWEPARKILVHESGIPLDSDKTREYPNNWIPWSPDGKYLAISQVEEKRLVVIDTKNGNTVFSKNYSSDEHEYIWNEGYSPDGKYLFTYDVGFGIKVLSTETWDTVFYIKDISTGSMFSWSPDGRYLVCYSEDFDNDTYSLLIISTDNWKTFKEISVDSPLPEADISWSPDGRYIAYFETGPVPHTYIKIIDASTWTVMNTSMDLGFSMVYPIRWSPDSKYMVSGNLDLLNMTGSISIWNTGTWNLERKIELGTSIPYSLSWNPNKPILAVGMESKHGNKRIPELKLMSTDNWSFYMNLKPMNDTELSHIQNNKFDRCFYSVAWSPDGNSLIAAYKDVWVYTTNESLFSGESIENPGFSWNTWLIVGAVVVIVIAVGVVWYWKRKG